MWTDMETGRRIDRWMDRGRDRQAGRQMSESVSQILYDWKPYTEEMTAQDSAACPQLVLLSGLRKMRGSLGTIH